MAGFPWPDGKKAAVALTFDVDGESIPHVYHPDGAAHRKLSLMSEHRYGPTVGLPRILDLFDLYEVKGTFFMPAYVAELHPEAVERIVRDGHQIGHHGYLHERPDTVSDELEEKILVKGIEVFENIAGVRPYGYRSPAWELKPSSPDLIQRHGFRYDSSLMGDDVPYLVSTAHGNLLEFPIHWIADDFPQFVQHGIGAPDNAFNVFAQEFEGIYQRGGLFTHTMHPFISGRPSRLLVLERLIRFMRGFPRVWWTTLDELAAYCARPEIQTALRVEKPEIPETHWLS